MKDGSTYFTFSLDRVRSAFAGREVRRMGSAELARVLEAHPLLRLRLVRLAREEAERRLETSGLEGEQSGGDEATETRCHVVPGTARVASTVTQDGDAIVFEVGLELPCGAEGESGPAVGSRRSGREVQS